MLPSLVMILVVTVASVLLARGGLTSRATRPADGVPSGHASSRARASPSPRTDPALLSPAAALSVLAALPVKGRAPLTGYTRAAFGQAWSDDTDDPGGHNGCDTRNDILRRDLSDLVLKPGTRGCVVLSGILQDPYGNSTIHFVRGVGTSTSVQIDHVVALADAWQKGAQGWSPQRRQAFANDPRELLAVSGRLNMSKGDGDTATWLPPYKPGRCAYVARQVDLKAAYGLWVTHAERDAMAGVLRRCGG